MPVVLAGAAVVAAGAMVYSAVEQKQAADNAGAVDNATAQYNAKYDESLAQQLDLDTQVNIDTERQNDSVYMSRQAASYASAGVLATTGSALDAQITNAGRFEQKIQQQWVNSQQQQESYYAQAKEGVAYGMAEAQADRMQGSIALINGGAKLASMASGDYESGVFSGLGGSSGYSNWTDGSI